MILPDTVTPLTMDVSKFNSWSTKTRASPAMKDLYWIGLRVWNFCRPVLFSQVQARNQQGPIICQDTQGILMRRAETAAGWYELNIIYPSLAVAWSRKAASYLGNSFIENPLYTSFLVRQFDFTSTNTPRSAYSHGINLATKFFKTLANKVLRGSTHTQNTLPPLGLSNLVLVPILLAPHQVRAVRKPRAMKVWEWWIFLVGNFQAIFFKCFLSFWDTKTGTYKENALGSDPQIKINKLNPYIQHNGPTVRRKQLDIIRTVKEDLILCTFENFTQKKVAMEHLGKGHVLWFSMIFLPTMTLDQTEVAGFDLLSKMEWCSNFLNCK